MVELKSKSPCHGLLPLELGSVSLTEETPAHVSLISVRKGQNALLGDLLSAEHGLSFPTANQSIGTPEARMVWFAQGQAMLFGPKPATNLVTAAMIVDQSDAWAIVRLEGAKAEDVLARLVPVDVRANVFKRGHTARTLLQHMTVSITRVEDCAFQIMAFRSMAGTLVHDLNRAMASVAARG
ncbi:hypothetical protein NBRC116594_07380 [Shimia sp. NS0008-38b]|uniref:sarcosine oxidase subunit gamma n=1 Tax=Shimia sp. NS0008-38b TaxID=3127653 RepID=UPI00310AE499